MAIQESGHFSDTFGRERQGDLDNRVRLSKWRERRYCLDFFDTNPIVSVADQADGTIVASGTTIRAVNSLVGSYWVNPLVGLALAGPFLVAGGWNISGDLANNDIIEFGPAGYTLSTCPFAFTVGTDGAFFLRVKFKITDVSGSDRLVVGFRKQEAGNGTHGSYDSYAAIGNFSGDIKIDTELAAGGAALLDTTQNWADTETHTLVVKVSATGVVTFEIDGAAPAVVPAFTFTNGMVVIPYLYLLHDSDVAEAVILSEWECGLQPSSRAELI